MKYAVLVLGLLVASYTIAQNHLEDFTLKRSLKQDGLQFNFTVLDDDKRGVKHHKPSKFYYWFKAQHVRATQGASSGRLLHGKFEAFYPDKQLAQQGSYKKGLKHGKWQYWYPDGSFKKVENWSQGTLHGKQKYFSADGLLSHMDIVRGGAMKKRITSDSTVIQKSFGRETIVLKDSLGREEEVQQFKNNQRHGTQKWFVEGKVDRKERYRKGELIEKEEKQPKVESEQTEKEPGKIQQLWQKWFDKDKKKSEKEKEGKKAKKEKKERKKKSKTEDVG